MPHSGTVTVDGGAPDLSSPHAALAAGRRPDGARPRGGIRRARRSACARTPISIPAAAKRGLFSVLSPAPGSRPRRRHSAARVDLRPNEPDLPIEGLSGGNQQKVVVGRWLATGRRLLVAEDPTAGVDVGAKAEIYRLIARALAAGLAVVVVSTDFEEVAHICHRALVFNRGRIIGELIGPRSDHRSA